MGLSSFIKKRDVKERFLEEFTKPNVSRKGELLAPPLTNHYQRVGIAFDYLLRFYIQRLNPNSIAGRWEADRIFDGVPKIIMEILRGSESNSLPKQLYNKVMEILSGAKKNLNEFLNTGAITIGDDLIKSTLLLAKINSIVYSPDINRALERLLLIDDDDVKDLRNLISVVDSNLFKNDDSCAVGATFNDTTIFGRAEADLVIGDALIDIKTTKDPKFWRDYFNQLMGYYSLYRIDGIKDMPETKINKIGVYFSRFGRLSLINIEKIVDENTFTEFLDWFKDRAKSS